MVKVDLSRIIMESKPLRKIEFIRVRTHPLVNSNDRSMGLKTMKNESSWKLSGKPFSGSNKNFRDNLKLSTKTYDLGTWSEGKDGRVFPLLIWTSEDKDSYHNTRCLSPKAQPSLANFQPTHSQSFSTQLKFNRAPLTTHQTNSRDSNLSTEYLEYLKYLL